MSYQKEMLVELLKEAIEVDVWGYEDCIHWDMNYEEAAEWLLNRVVVLPFKIGTPLYLIRYRTFFDDSVPGNTGAEYYIDERKYSPLTELGRHVFLDKGEAESKLKELNEELRKERSY